MQAKECHTLLANIASYYTNENATKIFVGEGGEGIRTSSLVHLHNMLLPNALSKTESDQKDINSKEHAKKFIRL